MSNEQTTEQTKQADAEKIQRMLYFVGQCRDVFYNLMISKRTMMAVYNAGPEVSTALRDLSFNLLNIDRVARGQAPLTLDEAVVAANKMLEEIQAGQRRGKNDSN